MPQDSRRPRPTATGKPAGAKMVPSGDQCRCGCGSMLARVVAEGIELKCRKCKSLVLIRHEELVEMYKQLGLQPSPKLPIQDLRPR